MPIWFQILWQSSIAVQQREDDSSLPKRIPILNIRVTFLVTRIYIVVTGASLNWNLTCITKGLAYDAVWSPDGSRISYVSRETGIDEIYVFDIGTETTRRLTTTPNFSNAGFFIYNQRPSWSPNGMQLVFKSNRDTNHFQIWNMNADGSAPRIISPSPYNDSDPIWVK